MQTLSISNEDYLERIAELIEKKGYARVSDIADVLHIKPASVTKMLQKLEEAGYIDRVKYRGLTLTEKGKHIGQRIGKRHAILQQFFSHLNLPQEIIDQDIDGIEHHLSDETLSAIQTLLRKLQK